MSARSPGLLDAAAVVGIFDAEARCIIRRAQLGDVLTVTTHKS